jgi:hypothetical protein
MSFPEVSTEDELKEQIRPIQERIAAWMANQAIKQGSDRARM